MENFMNWRKKFFWFVIFLGISVQYCVGSIQGEYSIIHIKDKKGLVNKKGAVLIPPVYEDLGWSDGSVELVDNTLGYKKNGLWGLVNIKNEQVTAPIFSYLQRLNEDRIIAAKKSSYNSTVLYGLIDRKGNIDGNFIYQRLVRHNDVLIATIEENGKYFQGVLDDHQKIIIPYRQGSVKPLYHQLLIVKDSVGKQAVYTDSGKGIIDFELDSVNVMNDSSALLYKDGYVGYINKDGSNYIRPKYQHINIDTEGLKVKKFREWKAFNNKNEYIRTYTYDNITPKARRLYVVEIGKAQALIDDHDSLLSVFSNYLIENLYDTWVLIHEGNKYGILNMDGTVFLKPVYDSIFFVHDQIIFKKGQNGDKGWGIMNRYGKVITKDLYDDISWLGATYYKVKKDGYWGIVSITGKQLIICKYDKIKEYKEGKLLVNYLGEDGILNMDGEWEIVPQKKEIEIVDPIRYLIRSPYGSYVAYYPNTIDFTAEYFLYKYGDRYLEKNLTNKYGMRDEAGVRIIEPEYDSIMDLQEDSIYIARADTCYSFITKSGKILNYMDPRFDEVRPIKEYFVPVNIDGEWGFVDLNGKLRIANQYQNVGNFNEGLAPVEIRNRWGYVDIREDLIVQPYYDTLYPYQGGVCIGVKKGLYGIINAEGRVVLECEYDNIQPIKTGGFVITKAGKLGMAAKDGRLLILPRFNKITDLNNGYVIAEKNGKSGVMTDEGMDIIPLIYDEIKYDPYNDVYLTSNAEEWITLNKPK